MQGSHKNRLASVWQQSLPDEQRHDPSHSWTNVAETWETELEHRMGDHPKLTLAIAAAFGFVVGWLVKRR